VISASTPRKAELGMTSEFRIALLQCPEANSDIEKKYNHIYNVESIKDLVRVFIETKVDLVVVGPKFKGKEKLKKVYGVYRTPFLFVNSAEKNISCDEFCCKNVESFDQIHKAISDFSGQILSARVQRENKRMNFVLNGITQFTQGVVHTTKDLFISETKNFFKKKFKVSRCHWVEVKTGSSKLPPILKLKQELENQKVDQGSLISSLDSCSVELFRSEFFQIWKNKKGEYLSLLWIPQNENLSQCIILNKVLIKNRVEFESFFHALVPFLKRRWDLCMTVGEAQQQVYKDSLTSLYNQKFLNEVVEKKIEENKRYKTPFSVLFIDVDHFKKVNDSLGHVVGSGVLTQMGDLLQEQIRTSDYAFRYGGDEFIILLSHTEGEDAVNVAERVRKKVENFHFSVNKVEVRITVSIGLAFFPLHAQSAVEIIQIADEAMYYGKNKSRNIVYKAG